MRRVKIKEIESRVLASFKECQVAVYDLTGVGESFEIRLSTPDLLEKSRIERHQSVMVLFNQELKEGKIHALSIKYLK